jgi:hypothetical protein
MAVDRQLRPADRKRGPANRTRHYGVRVTLGDIATAAGVLVALVLGVVSLVQARSSDARASEANETAARALEVAERQLALQEEAPGAYRPPWTLARTEGSELELTNTGTEDASYVTVHPPEDTATRGALEFDSIEAGSSVVFTIIETSASGRSLTVTWARPDGTPQTWTKAIPPRTR